MHHNIESKINENLRRLKDDHETNMARIGEIVVLESHSGKIDRELTEAMRREDAMSEAASYQATRDGISAFERLFRLAETRRSGQIKRVARFLAVVWGVAPGLKPDDLKSLDREIGDDMLAVLDAIRWNRMSVYELSTDAGSRVPAVLREWGYEIA